MQNNPSKMSDIAIAAKNYPIQSKTSGLDGLRAEHDMRWLSLAASQRKYCKDNRLELYGAIFGNDRAAR